MGDLARPHRLTPNRRLILYLLSARLVIGALPFLGFGFSTGRPPAGTHGVATDSGRGPRDWVRPRSRQWKGGPIGAPRPDCQIIPGPAVAPRRPPIVKPLP